LAIAGTVYNKLVQALVTSPWCIQLFLLTCSSW